MALTFPLDTSKEYKILSNTLSSVQLLVIKFPNHLFLVTFYQVLSILNQTTLVESVIWKCENRVLFIQMVWGCTHAVNSMFLPFTYYATQ